MWSKMPEVSKWLIAAGVFLIIAGVTYGLLGNRIQFLGKLPGDIRIERDNFKIYIPITTMLLISAAIQFIIWIFRLWKK
jgi:hypothetical protein